MQVVTCDADHPVRQPTGELLLRHPAAQVGATLHLLPQAALLPLLLPLLPSRFGGDLLQQLGIRGTHG
jgi:hypothetical protein